MSKPAHRLLDLALRQVEIATKGAGAFITPAVREDLITAALWRIVSAQDDETDLNSLFRELDAALWAHFDA